MEIDPALAFQAAKQAIKDYHQTENDPLLHLQTARRNFAFAAENFSDSMSSLKALIGLSHTYGYMADIDIASCTTHAQCAVSTAERALSLCREQFPSITSLEASIHDALGCALRRRYAYLKEDDDCDRAIAAQRTALEQTPSAASESVRSLRKYHLAYALYTSLRHSREVNGETFMPKLAEAININPTEHQSSVHYPAVKILAGGLLLLLARSIFECAYVTTTKSSLYRVNGRQRRLPPTDIGTYELQTQTGKICLRGVIDCTGEHYRSIYGLNGQHHFQIGTLGVFGVFVLLFDRTEEMTVNVTDLGELALRSFKSGLFHFGLPQVALLMDILYLLVEIYKGIYGQEIPGLIEELYGQLDQILPQTHVERPQLHFLLGQSLLMDQQHSKERGLRNINYSNTINQFRQALRLTLDWHPSQAVYLTHLISALSCYIEASGSVAETTERKDISQEIQQWLGVVNVLRSFHSPDLSNTQEENLLIECIKTLGMNLSDTDTWLYYFGLMDQMLQNHDSPEPHVSLSQSDLESAAQMKLTFMEAAVACGAVGSLPRRYANDTVLQWQELHTSRTVAHMSHSDIEFGLGFALGCQAKLMLLEENDLQEAYRLLSSGISHMIAATENQEPVSVTDIQNMTRLADACATRDICDVKLTHCPSDSPASMNMFQYVAAAALSLSLPPRVLYDIFNRWACHAVTLADESALDAYGGQVNALTQLSWIEVDLQARYARLQASNRTLAADAAACACVYGNLALSINFLESGRTILFEQTLPLRNQYTELRKFEPQLATELERVGRSIERQSFQSNQALLSPPNQLHMTMDDKYQESYQLRCLGQEWDNLVACVRRIEGYEDFLQTPPLEKLCQAAAHGPITFIVTSERHEACYAITIKSPSIDSIQSIKLPLSPSRAKELAKQFEIIVSDPAQRTTADCNEEDRGFKRSRPKFPRVTVYEILTELWRLVMKPIIDLIQESISIKKPHLPHIWISATGGLSSLPLHAAGEYRENGTTVDSECVLDHVICSYTPSLSALLRQPPMAQGNRRAHIFALGEGVGLLEAPKEVDIVRSICGQWANVHSLPGRATIQEVKYHLRDANIVHFACHGTHDLTNPLKSKLMFSADAELEIEELMQEPLPNARLAILLACETAQGDQELTDESLHIAGTMLFAGFRGAIGSLWKMDDADGPRICKDFYSALLEGGGDEFPYHKAGEALHRAVSRLKASGASVFRWATFVHVGQ